MSTEQLSAAIESAYRRRTPRSEALYRRALQSLPGGDSRTSVFYQPYPAFMSRGQGCRLEDIDGNTYIDFLGNYTSLVHGHAHPGILAAIQTQAALGTAHGAPVELQVLLAEALTKRVKSLAQVRFANSGTEAVLNAIRAARAFTGRPRILKMEGGYHGTYDAAEVSVDPGADPPAFPLGRPEGPGLSPGLTGEVLITPFNDLDRARDVVRRHRAELAAVIVEPMLGAAGMIPAEPEFLGGLREITRECGVLLICDEVLTFRLAFGGAQELFGIEPDLTTLGKIIGGGLPVGAFGGRADIMACFDPRRSGFVGQAGTFNANALTLAAGLAALELLTHDAITRINRLGDTLRAGLQDTLSRLGIPGQVTGAGSLAHVHFCEGPVRDYRSAAAGQRTVWRWLHLVLLHRGIFVAPRGSFVVSTPMAEPEIRAAIAQFGDALAEVQPLAVAPALTALA
ncbi:MAG: aspartate aminotransferase family protein [Gemmatimonadetes bacterium]|nr:aspartate aminotransferase family protein [Gemmatimonadota bacterium]